MHSVYVLHSAKDGHLYMGYTTNMAQRIQAHNNGSVLSTKARRPLRIIFMEIFTHKHDALRRERYFKTNEGKKMLKRILRETLANVSTVKSSSSMHEEEQNQAMEDYQLRWKTSRERAKEIIRDRGWTEDDDDFLIQVEEEAKRQWMEDIDREIYRML